MDQRNQLQSLLAQAVLAGGVLVDLLLRAASSHDTRLVEYAQQQLMLRRNGQPSASPQVVRVMWEQMQAPHVWPLSPSSRDAAAHLLAATHLLNRSFSMDPLPRDGDEIRFESWCVTVAVSLREDLIAVGDEWWRPSAGRRGYFQVASPQAAGVLFVPFAAVEEDAESRRYSVARAHYEVALRYLQLDEQQTYAIVHVHDDRRRRPAHPAAVHYAAVPPHRVEMLHPDIDIASSKSEGQYARSRGILPKGTMVLAERPYAAVLLPSRYDSHCVECFNRMAGSFRCPGCGIALFCSVQCQEIAAVYHRYECSVMADIINLEVTRCMRNSNEATVLAQLALRMVTQFSMEQNRELYRLGLTPSFTTVRRSRSEEGEPLTRHEQWVTDRQLARGLRGIDHHTFEPPLRRACRIHALSTDLLRRPTQDYLQFLTIAVALKEILLRTEYFDSAETIEYDEMVVLDLLMRNMMQVSNNHHYITYMSGAPRITRRIHVGIAIYATGALFHCDSLHNVTRSFDGKMLMYHTSSDVIPTQAMSDNIIGFELRFTAGALSKDALLLPPSPGVRCIRCADNRYINGFRYRGPFSEVCQRKCTSFGCTILITSNFCAQHRLCASCVARLRSAERRISPFLHLYLNALDEQSFGDMRVAGAMFLGLLEALRAEEVPPRTLCHLVRASYHACLLIMDR